MVHSLNVQSSTLLLRHFLQVSFCHLPSQSILVTCCFISISRLQSNSFLCRRCFFWLCFFVMCALTCSTLDCFLSRNTYLLGFRQKHALLMASTEAFNNTNVIQVFQSGVFAMPTTWSTMMNSALWMARCHSHLATRVTHQMRRWSSHELLVSDPPGLILSRMHHQTSFTQSRLLPILRDFAVRTKSYTQSASEHSLI